MPVHDERYEVCLRLVEFFEGNDEEQFTVSNLVAKMGEFLNRICLDPYYKKYLNISKTS